MPANTGTGVSLVRGKVIRLTKIDACGMPVAGAANSWVSRGFITVKLTKKWDNGTEIKVPAADGSVQVYEQGTPTLLTTDVEIELLKVDTGVVPMCTGLPTVVDWQGSPVGWEDTALQGQSGSNFGLEVWSGVSNGACVAGGVPYGYWTVPAIGYVTFNFDDIANKEINGHLMGSTIPNSWGRGPYPAVVGTDASNTPGRLINPIDPRSSQHFERTFVAPPVPPTLPGPVALTLPTPY